jgi:hypothetical protein
MGQVGDGAEIKIEAGFSPHSRQNDKMEAFDTDKMPLTDDAVMLLEYSKIIKEQSKQHRETLERFDKTSDMYQAMITKARDENESHETTIKTLRRDIASLKACVESHETTIKTLRRDIAHRIKEDNASVLLSIADLADVRCEVSRIFGNKIHDNWIDRSAESCFNWMKCGCQMPKDYVSDAVREWWEEEGKESYEIDTEPAYAPKSDAE